MKRLFLLPLLIFYIFCLNTASAQDDLSNKIIETLKKNIEEFPQEKIYLHLDKPYYVSGDIIWFKAYLVAGSYHQPSPLSMTIHVELIDAKSEVIQSILVKSDSGFSVGSLILPDSLPGGSYLLRAYTPWMKNFPDAYFYQREITILNPAGSTPTMVKEGIDLQFFPESGELLYDVRSKIAFKAIGPDGLSRKIKLRVFDDTDSLIVETESNALGMGAFVMLPTNGKKYFARINSTETKISLPTAKTSGFNIMATLSVNKPNITCRLQSTSMTAGKQGLTIVSHSRGIVNYVAKVDLSHNLAFVQIPKSSLLSGISTITLFTSTGQPVAERLVFVDHEDDLSIEVTMDKESKEYSVREKITIQLKVTDKENNPIVTNLSMAICDDQQVILDEENVSIKNYLLLTSDLIGHIENPGYYFNPLNGDRVEAVDYLLMTQGWRRFKWEEVLQNKWFSVQYPIDKGLSISGNLKDNLTKKPIQGGKVTYLSDDPKSDLQIAITGESGLFSLYNLIYYDTTNIVLQGENKRGNKGVLFEIKEDLNHPIKYNPKYVSKNLKEFEKSIIEKSLERKKIDAAYQFDEKTIILDEIEILADKIDEKAEAKVYGKGNATLVADEIPGSQTYLHPLQLLQGRVSGVLVSGSGLNYSITIRGVGSTTNNTPLIMVDNITIDINSLAGIPVRNIESVEVFKGPEAAVFGSDGANGAVLFYTKKGSNWKPPVEGMYTLQRTGYHTAKEFYSPKYDVKRPEHVKPDIRPTIFWKPLIQTDENGLATISFYSNDNKSTMTGIIEGISSYGKLAHGKFHFKVTDSEK